MMAYYQNTTARQRSCRWFSVVVCIAAAAAIWPHVAWADGGVPLTMRDVGGYRIAVFAEPAPLRAGPVDISVMVQDAQSGEQLDDTMIDVRVQSVGPVVVRRDSPATEEAATNKLFKAAHLTLPFSGHWQVQVEVDGRYGKAEVTAEMVAGTALPRWQRLWAWFTWPAVPVGLFLLNQWLAARQERRRTPTFKAL